MTLTAEREQEIRERLAKATAGPWETDATKNDGEYGGGPDCGSGFSSYEVMAASGRICDTLNSDVAMVCEEYDEEGCIAFDEVGRDNMEFIAHARQDIPDLLAALTAANERAERTDRLLETAISNSSVRASVLTAQLDAAKAENETLRLLQEFAEDLAWRSYLGILVLQTVLKKSKLEAGADVSAKLLADIAIQYPHFPAKSALRTTARNALGGDNG